MKRLSCVAALIFAAFVFAADGGAKPLLPEWPQAHSDIPADPAITFGTLPNGLRYLIKQNTTPTHQIALRLRVAAGSLDETEAEEGLAHFVEHMAFRGSTHFADGELFKALERLGAGRGRDTNAFTHPDSTIYVVDLPVNDAAALDTALSLLRDVADGIAFDAKAVESERAVVLAEMRQKDVAALHAWNAYSREMFGARLAEAMTPIGKDDIVRNASAATLRAFYRSHYRPELTVLTVVGDVDAAAAQAAILKYFASWKDAAPAAPRPAYAPTTASGLSTTAFSEEGAANDITLSWPMAHDSTPDSLAKARRSALRTLAFSVLNERLHTLARSANPPFLGASAGRREYYAIADATNLSVGYAPGEAFKALRAARAALDEALRDGVHQDEVDRAVAARRASYEVSLAASRTLPSAVWSSAYMSAIGSNEVISTPTEAFAEFQDAVKNLTANEVSACLRAQFAGAPKVFLSSSSPIADAEKSVAAVFAESEPAAPAAAQPALAPWPYITFGPAAKAAITGRIDDLGATYAMLSNGVRVTVKPTKLLEGQITIHVLFGDGRLGFAKDRKSPSWALGDSYIGGGLTRVSVADLPKVLSGKEASVHFAVWDTAFEFTGSTRPADYETELEVMAAYLTDPAWRPAALELSRAAMLNSLSQMTARAEGVFGGQYWVVAHDNDKRWQLPTPDEVRATRLDEVKALLKNALADAPMEVIVVGDISVEDALKGLETTLGALPKRRLAKSATVGDERQPSPQEIMLRYQGPGDQSIATITWPASGVFPEMRRERVHSVLMSILAQRLFDELRNQTGMTYTPGHQLAGSLATPGYGFLSVWANVPAARIADFYAAVDKTIGALKATEVSADELERARDVRLRGEEQAQQSNGYWAWNLMEAQVDPRRLDLIRTSLSDLKSVTAADVLEDARATLVDDKAWKFLVVPQDYAPPAK